MVFFLHLANKHRFKLLSSVYFLLLSAHDALMMLSCKYSCYMYNDFLLGFLVLFPRIYVAFTVFFVI